MLDELTPYYQARLDWLSSQQREIVEFLARAKYAVPVKEIAAQLFLPHQTVTAQLRELKQKGYVLSNQVGREARYELTEPLMRLASRSRTITGSRSSCSSISSVSGTAGNSLSSVSRKCPRSPVSSVNTSKNPSAQSIEVR